MDIHTTSSDDNIISWFSCGVSSTVACKLAMKKFKNLRIVYIDIEDHHKDNARFIKECEAWFGRKIEVLKSPYAKVENVIRQFRFINSAYGAKCTDILKKRVRKDFEISNRIDGYVWGFDASTKEKRRAERLVEAMPNLEHYFPLIEEGMSKENAHGYLESVGIKRPVMYDLGFPNNNCIGCVKGGMGYWLKIKELFPEKYKTMAELERLVGRSCIKGIFLDELESGRGRDLKVIVPDCGHFCERN